MTRHAPDGSSDMCRDEWSLVLEQYGNANNHLPFSEGDAGGHHDIHRSADALRSARPHELASNDTARTALLFGLIRQNGAACDMMHMLD